MSPLDPPASDQIEVSLFGPGYGEAVALHIGNGKWILIDSCTAYGTETPIQLHYLREIGVDVRTAVVLIVVSHWHDDHVRGVSALVRECASARVSLSNALRQEEFLTLAALYEERPLPEGSGIDELIAVLRHLEETHAHAGFRGPEFVTVDRTLLREELVYQNAPIPVTLFALSPSDAATLRSKTGFARLIPPPATPRRRIAPLAPNEASVAVLLEVGQDVILLGSDLEATANPAEGWSAVHTSQTVVNRARASVFKVPHHGAASGHDGRVWSDLLVRVPYAVLTAFQRGGRILPSAQDILRIRALTSKAFVAGLYSTRRWRPAQRVVADMVDDVTRSFVEIVPTMDQIRLRKAVNAASDWSVDLFGRAQELQPPATQTTHR